MSAELWLYQNSKQSNSSWFVWTKRIRCWYESNEGIEFVGQLKNNDCVNAGSTQSISKMRLA